MFCFVTALFFETLAFTKMLHDFGRFGRYNVSSEFQYRFHAQLTEPQCMYCELHRYDFDH